MIAQVLNTTLPTLRGTDTVEHALDLLQDFQATYLLVAENNAYLGLVNATILSYYDANEYLQHIPLVASDITIEQEAHLFEALQQFEAVGVPLLAVVDEAGQYVGSISRNDALNALNVLVNGSEKGAILVISLPYRDYSLAEISRLVESNGVKVLSANYQNQTPQNENATLTLKLNQHDVSKVIPTLERFDYQIEAVYAHTPIESVEQERYDMLMKYLSV